VKNDLHFVAVRHDLHFVAERFLRFWGAEQIQDAEKIHQAT
jgi:hypothetical protein